MGKISGEEGFISLGPWGAKRGAYCAYKPDGPIMQITIGFGDIIDSILFESKSSDGVLIGNRDKFGGDGPHKKTFCINTSVEQLSSISLTYGDHYGEITIGSLYFNTNRNTYGVTGTRVSRFSSVFIPMEGGVFEGFHGYAGSYINAFGVFVAPKVDHKKIEEELKTKNEDLNTKIKELKERENGLLRKMKEAEGKNEVLTKRNKEEVEELEIKIKELKEKEDGFLRKMKEMEAQNEVLRERNKVLDKEVLLDLHITIKRGGVAVEPLPVPITLLKDKLEASGFSQQH